LHNKLPYQEKRRKKKPLNLSLDINPKTPLGLLACLVAKIQPYSMIYAKNRGLNVDTIIQQQGLIHQRLLSTLSGFTLMLLSRNLNSHSIKNYKSGVFRLSAPAGAVISSKKTQPLMCHINTGLWGSGQKKAEGESALKLMPIKMAIRFINQYSTGTNGKYGSTSSATICPILRFTMRVLTGLVAWCARLFVTPNQNLLSGNFKFTKTAGLKFMPRLNVL